MGKFNVLYDLRQSAGLSRPRVARFYGQHAPVSRERIRQLEILPEVSAKIEKQFRAAIKEALDAREAAKEILVRVRTELRERWPTVF